MKQKKIWRTVWKTAVCFLVLISLLLGGSAVYFTNAFSYGSKFHTSFMEKEDTFLERAMILAPHEDDDINLAGGLIANLTKNHHEVICLFATNGDKYKLGERRIGEASKAEKALGVRSGNIVFLGYGDTWKTKYKHIYNAPGDEVISSYIKRTETYGTKRKPDFRTQISGKSSLYTRNNFKKDIKDAILKYRPTSIFAVDFDTHADHRATGLLFEEALAEILKEQPDYRPVVMKGFAYSTGWRALPDFYAVNLRSVQKPDPKRQYMNSRVYQLENPSYQWKNRVRFPVSSRSTTHLLLTNRIYKALVCNNSQHAKYNATKIINGDQVFWQRRTDSLSYQAALQVTSGTKEYLNDFKLIDVSDIMKKGANCYDRCVWSPDGKDTQKTAKMTFSAPCELSQISLYDNFTLRDNILEGILTFSDGSQIQVPALQADGSETKISFPAKKNIQWVSFQITKAEGQRPGLCEWEAYAQSAPAKPQMIKLMHGKTEDFLYRCFVSPGETAVPLAVYSYPLNSAKAEDVQFRLVSNPGNHARMEGTQILFDQKFSSCTLRAELKSDPSVYDEINFKQLSKSNAALLTKSMNKEKQWLKYVEKLELKQKTLEKKIKKKLHAVKRKIIS